MSLEKNLVERTLAAGTYGIKKTDLRKEFGDQFEAALDSALQKGAVFVEKRGGAYYCWHREFYVQSLLNSDPKFKLTYDLITSLQQSIENSSAQVAKSLEVLSGNVSNLAKLVLEREGYYSAAGQASAQADSSAQHGGNTAPAPRLRAADFQKEFDTILASNSSSIGWVELAKIKNELCEKYDLGTDEFYRLVSEITLQQQNRYELSTGGGEGVMVRGLLHGFVRCIA